ncbi:hypothetical protein [Xenorhabdus bharatensis]|uniref:hypothetical protein n=1 Tax=Xenorhabdus bharatensis TaxID=3136256 RepID=UPI0030F4AFB3
MNGYYYTDCPNMLLHKDFGFSLRGFEKYSCSICNEDPVDCDHRTGQQYNDIKCESFDGRCNICCGDIEKCDHSIGEPYDNVKTIKVVSELKLITFDLVKDPEFVFARILEIQYSKKQILDMLANAPNRERFLYGESYINCNPCTTCKGYDPSVLEKIFEQD